MAHKVTLRFTRISQRITQYTEVVQRQHCLSCQQEVEVLTSVEASSVLRIDQPALSRLIADGSIHAIQSVGGNSWVCRNSLLSQER